jgi:hypothetical protein
VPIEFAAAYYRILRRASPALPQPQINDISASGGLVTMHFTGVTNDLPAVFVTLSAWDVDGPYSSIANVTITTLGPGLFQAVLPDPYTQQFYKIVR